MKRLLPIVLDLEMSGLDLEKCGIWQIGAVDLNTMEEFFQESKIDDEDVVDEGALKVIGKTEEELRNHKKQSQKEMLINFFRWVEERKLRNFLCQNPQFDVGFLYVKANKYGLKKTFHYRSFDMHTIAQIMYHGIHNEFYTEEHHCKMGLTSIIEFCGMEDKRLKMKGDVVESDGNPHNALEDAKLTAECFYRMMYGKNLFPEYAKYKIPKYLEKESEK